MQIYKNELFLLTWIFMLFSLKSEDLIPASTTLIKICGKYMNSNASSGIRCVTFRAFSVSLLIGLIKPMMY